MTRDAFDTWLTAYGNAWRYQDPDAVVELFTDDAVYIETPFSEAMVGLDAIREYWVEGAQQAQRDITFTCEVLAVSEEFGIATWKASFTRVPSGIQVQLDGVLYATFDTSQRCKIFREWWHRKETQPEPAAA